MIPFLKQIATVFFKEIGNEISDYAFVFPNRRAGIFFQKYLSEITEKPIFSPRIFTINDLFVDISKLQKADHLNLLFKLYQLYIQLIQKEESFDEFIYWGEMLLSDFDDIDKYDVNAKMLFSNLEDIKELDHPEDYLSEEQIEAIRSFWQHFNPTKPNEQEFLSIWNILYQLYKLFKEELVAEGKGYEGMIFREVANCSSFDLPYKKIVFVGLNALSTTEIKFLKTLQKQGIADFYWDYDSDFFKDKSNPASYFLEQNLKHFPSTYTLESPRLPQPSMEVIGIPSDVGQAKLVYSLLEEAYANKALSKEEALKTAIVLPNEQLLIPVLNAIPETIKRINVTMGYPLSKTAVASFMEGLVLLQKNKRNSENKTSFYFRNVLKILGHKYIKDMVLDESLTIIQDINEMHKVYIPAEELQKNTLLKNIFTPIQDTTEFLTYLLNVLETLGETFSNNEEENDNDEKETTQSFSNVEKEFIYHYYTAINRMKDIISTNNIEMQIDTFYKLLQRITDVITIPFYGEPLSGLQIMGVLETRALDFDRIIILSVNEGIFPTKKVANSFIPYNLRKGFKLPTYEHQDAIWAYHFYRLIQRASHISFVYDTRTEGTHTGEVSRFIHQLKYLYNCNIKEKLMVYQVSSDSKRDLIINKDEAILEKLSNYLENGNKTLSASAINTYVDCPLRFYLQYIEGLKEEDEITEKVESNDFGSIVHKVMELIYQPYENKEVPSDILKNIYNNDLYLTKLINTAYAKEFFKTDNVKPLKGQHYLIGEIIRKYVKQILLQDSKLEDFKYLKSEMLIKKTFTLGTSGLKVRIKGFIDRIDLTNEGLRIIDYKSGNSGGKSIFSEMNQLFDPQLSKRPKAVMQVFLYAWLYGSAPEGVNYIPGIYHMRELFNNNFSEKIIQSKVGPVLDFNNYRDDFLIELSNCLEQIFDKNTPFTPTFLEENCTYCPFKSICGK